MLDLQSRESLPHPFRLNQVVQLVRVKRNPNTIQCKFIKVTVKLNIP